MVKGLQRGREESLTRSLEVYRKYLYLEGDERRESLGPDGRVRRGALDAKAVEEVLRKKGRLPVGEYVRCRVRYFSDGLVLGGKEYVEGVYGRFRDRFGEKRKSGARKMHGLEGGGLYTMRDLRVRVFG